jgi:hypothetical protein
MLQLVDFIAEHCMWGSKQYITLWRDLENDSFEMKTDEHLLEWFVLNVDKGVACINAQINDFEGPLQFSPTKRRCHPSVRSRVHLIEGSTNEGATTNDDEGVGDEDEGVGDDKGTFSDSSYDTDIAASSASDDDCSDPEFGPDGEILDDVDEYDAPMFSYDPNDPCIDVNVVFSYVDQCSLQLHIMLSCMTMLLRLSKKIKKDLEPYARELIRVVSGLFSHLQARSTLDAR